MASHFEAKLHGFRRTQDGVVISYVVHPQDLSAEMAMAALGTRYMVAFSQIGDDEKPITNGATVAGSTDRINGQEPDGNGNRDGNSSKGVTAGKDRQPFNGLKLSNQAALRCNDEQFKVYLMDEYPSVSAKYNDAADVVRELCSVKSRAEFDNNVSSASHWRDLESEYQDWLVTKKYRDSVR